MRTCTTGSKPRSSDSRVNPRGRRFTAERPDNMCTHESEVPQEKSRNKTEITGDGPSDRFFLNCVFALHFAYSRTHPLLTVQNSLLDRLSSVLPPGLLFVLSLFCSRLFSSVFSTDVRRYDGHPRYKQYAPIPSHPVLELLGCCLRLATCGGPRTPQQSVVTCREGEVVCVSHPPHGQKQKDGGGDVYSHGGCSRAAPLHTLPCVETNVSMSGSYRNSLPSA